MKRKNVTIAKEITADYLRRKEERRGIESNWALNANFFAGNQYSVVMPSGEVKDSGKDYYWQDRGVYNHIAPIIETRLAKFSGLGASITVRPASGDFGDVNAAKFSTKLLKSVEHDINFKKLISDATFWSEICGTSFYKICWDANKGKILSDGLYEGDVEVSVCPPYEIFPDSLSAKDVDECKSIIHARAYPKETVEEHWGVKLEGGKVDVINPEFVYNGASKSGLTDNKPGYVTVIERYSLPDSENPDGRFTVVAEDKVLYDGSLPYLNGNNGLRRFPFVRQVALEQPASFFGGSVIDRLIPVQRAYNAVKNRKHEYMNRMAMGVLMVEDGSIDVDDIEEEGIAPGKIIVYRQGSNMPVLLNMGGVPNDFNEEETRLLNEFVTVSGVSDFLTSGTIAKSNLSGVALNLIIEQDNNRLSVTTSSIRRAAMEVGKHILRLYKQFAANGRLKRISGETGEIEMREFAGSDITSDDLVFDVENETVNSQSVRQSLAEELVKLGVLTGEDGRMSDVNRMKILEIMGFGNWENALSDKELHAKRAEKENTELKEKTPEVADTDDHNIHIAEHTRYLISNDVDEKMQEKLSEHIRRHRVYARLKNEADTINNNI
ncbi:MAG: hypothetical protein SO386_07125 [Eubacteriales bacterium]|nr:hypothetical protein [Eubacteriales bacterium]